MDAEMFGRFEDSALLAIGWLLQLKGKQLEICETDKLHKEMEQTVTHGSGLGLRAHDLIQTLTIGCDAMGAEIEKALIGASVNDEADIRRTFNTIRTLNQFERHQAYIDVVRAEPADMLPTLLSCSADDLRFLFQDLPPSAAEASTYWKNVRADLRAFAVRLMRQCAEAKQKLLQDPAKLELLGIAVSPRTVTQADAPAEYVDIEVLRQDLLSKGADPDMERLLADLELRFGDRIPLSQLIEFTECEIANGKAQMKGLVEKAHSEGKTISIEAIRKKPRKSEGRVHRQGSQRLQRTDGPVY